MQACWQDSTLLQYIQQTLILSIIFLSDQIVDEGKFLFIEFFQPINEEEVIQLEYDHFATLNEFMLLN